MNIKKIIAGGLVVMSVLGFSAVALANNGVSVMGMFDKGDKGEQMRMAHALGSTMEVHISDGGAVLVRGAKVTSVSGNTINANVVWGSASMSWAIVTDSNTNFLRFFGSAGNISEVAVGDFVSFSGAMVTTNASPFSVQAKIVKDWSDQKAAPVKTTVEGKMKVVAANAMPTSFVLTVGNKDYTVRVASGTAVLNALWLNTSIVNMHVGDTVRVYGQINSDNTIDATVVRDTLIKI